MRELSRVIDANTLDKARSGSSNSHFWQGKPGLWRDLIGTALASRIQSAHGGLLETLDYTIDGARELTTEAVLQFWRRIA